MSKYRKKPVVIEATRWWVHGDHPKVRRLPPDFPSDPTRIIHEMTYGWIDTLEGGHVVTPGDWIIKGVQGEFYPCKPDIFEATYEKVEEC